MSTLINFRDFGGDETLSGARVRTGRLFRSGHLAGLDPDSRSRLIEMDFAEIVDLRYADERDKDRSPWPDDALDRVIAHDGAATEEAPHLRIMRAAALGNGEIDAAYAAFYADLPFDFWYRGLFAVALDRVARTSGRVLIHCTAGKDRTGMFVALLLELLGVSTRSIVADYMLSQNAPGFSRLREDVIQRFGKAGGASIDAAQADTLIGVKPAYITAALDSIMARCGTVEAYFREAGVAADVPGKLRANFLEQALIT